MPNEKQYLEELQHQVNSTIHQLRHEYDIEEFADQHVSDLIKKTMETEAQLREKHEIGTRFNVLKTQLSAILQEIEKSRSAAAQKNLVKPAPESDESKTMIYISLFNATGDQVPTWSKLLNTQALLDHSVNRPIYANKPDVEAALRAKPNKMQQAYLVVLINKADILSATSLRDPIGLPLLRIKQGSLRPANIKLFVHNGKEYIVNPHGMLLPK